MDEALARISKFLSYVLRHQPEAIGLALDAEGWAEVDAVVAKAEMPITRELLIEAVEKNDKKRFALSDDKRFVRAVQGHSVEVDLRLTPVEPPETLFHGTAERFLAAILAEGLSPRERKYVHLSGDVETAIAVGKRHGAPVVLSIAAGSLHRGGRRFFQAENGVWLTDAVPADAISIRTL